MRNILFLFFVLSLAVSSLCLPQIAHAQGVDDFDDIDIEAIAFPNTKQGCAKKTSFFVAVTDNFTHGTDPSELGSMKIMKPLVQKIYEDLGKKGVAKASLDAIEDYQKCAAHADKEKDEAKEQEQERIYKSCSAINDVLIGTLKAAKSGRSKDSVLSKFKYKKLDVSGTSMEGMEDPSVYLVERIYQRAEKSYDSAVDFAVKVSVDCLNQR